jgi:hypothetical protein
VLWKVPAQGDMRLSIHPRFPEACALGSEPVAFQVNGAYIERTSIACKGGLAGHAIGVDGLSATMTDVLVRSVRADGSVQVARLSPSTPAFVLEATPRSLDVGRAYTLLGVEHILRGIDHLLFVLALMLLVRNKWLLVKTITAFTVAHSITLAAATLGWVRVSQPPVEAVIALSILFLASELAKQHAATLGSWHAARGSWRSSSDCSTVSASRVRCARSDYPKATYLSPCSLSTLAWNLGNCCSWVRSSLHGPCCADS